MTMNKILTTHGLTKTIKEHWKRLQESIFLRKNILEVLSSTFCQNNCLLVYATSNYMFKVQNKNTRKRCEIWSHLTIKTPERRQWCRSGVFIVNFEHISHLVSCVSTVNFEQANAGWVERINYLGTTY